jgi:hypothetical protein
MKMLQPREREIAEQQLPVLLAQIEALPADRRDAVMTTVEAKFALVGQFSQNQLKADAFLETVEKALKKESAQQ